MKYNPIGWFEIYVSDMQRAKTFYETIFMYELVASPKIEGMEDDYEMVFFPFVEGAPNSSGALVKMNDFKPGVGGTMIYFSSEDCAVEMNRVENAGGNVVQPKFSIGEFGFICLCMDTEGNMFGIHSMK